MKKTFLFLTNYFKILLVLIIGLFCLTNVSGQIHPKMKINLKNGQVIQGSKGIIEGDNVILQVKGVQSTYSLAEVNQVMAKKGLAGKFSAGCCGGCASAILIASLIPTQGTTKPGIGTMLGGAAVLGLMGGGFGYIVGLLFDRWNPVYTGGPTAFLHKMDFKLGPDNRGGFQFGLSYKF